MSAARDCPGTHVPMDFSTFVLSVGTSALVALGRAPQPEDGALRVDLPMAKQNIDILCMLREKTKGNLSAEEQHLLETLLYDLRMGFIQAVDAKKDRTP